MPPAIPDQHTITEVHHFDEFDLASLSKLLIDAVANGASVGFLAPMSVADARNYWQQTLPQLGSGLRLWVFRRHSQIVGAIQLIPCLKPNGRHRAEVVKLLVHQQWRRRGIAKALLTTVESAAASSNIRLLFLDTLSHSDAAQLYRKAGWIEAGSIPDYALDPLGQAFSTTIFYRILTLN